MKTFVLSILLALSIPCQAKDYWVRADGTATKANAIGPDSLKSKTMSMATFNQSSFSAGDRVYISASGGKYTTGLCNNAGGSCGVANNALSSGNGGSPFQVIGVPDSLGKRPLIDGAALSTPQIAIGVGADYITVSGIDVLGSTITPVRSVFVDNHAGRSGFGVYLKDIKILSNNRNNISGDHDCFVVSDTAGSDSQVWLDNVSAAHCLAYSGEGVANSNQAFTAHEKDKLKVTNSTATDVNQCVGTVTSSQFTATGLVCDQILYTAMSTGSQPVQASQSCDNCRFNFNSTYAGGSGNPTIFGDSTNTGLATDSIVTVTNSIISIGPTYPVGGGSGTVYAYLGGTVNFSGNKWFINSPKFSLWTFASSASPTVWNMTGDQLIFNAAIATGTDQVFASNTGAVLNWNGNTFTFNPTNNLKSVDLLYTFAGGTLNSSSNIFNNCGNLHNSPTTPIQVLTNGGNAGTVNSAGDACQ